MSAGLPHILRLPPCANVQEARGLLARALEEPDARRGSKLADASFLRLELPLRDEPDLLTWLAGFPALPRAYWADRQGDFRLAAAGIADESEGAEFAIIEAMLERVAVGDAAESVRLIGTARFDLGRPPDRDWKAFHRVHVQLPLLELRRTGTECLMAVNLKAGAGLKSGAFDTQRRIAGKALREGAALRGPPIAPPLEGASPKDDPQAWDARVTALLGHIAAGELEKAVLARCATYTLDMDPLELLRRLTRTQPEAFHFFLQPTPQLAFLGASPERLYRRRGRALETEALAGTRRRGATPEDDEQLVQALLASKKDAREHELVRQYIHSRLVELCDAVSSAEPRTVKRLAHVVHLHTPLSAHLKEGVGDAALLAALHPTPAVCGMPPAAGMAFIRENERFDRGLYCGPVGCFGRDEADCAVAIRSALVRPDVVRLYAGAGIVDGSDARAEWCEATDKMRALAEAGGFPPTP